MDCSVSQLDELIKKKMAEVKRLSQERESLMNSRRCIPDPEIEALNSDLFCLMAVVKHLKESQPEFMPKNEAFLYHWAQCSLEEDVREREEELSNLEKMHEESFKERESLIERSQNLVEEDVNRKMLGDARSKNELLHCLHRKVVRRLRRLSRRFSTFPEIPKNFEKLNASTRDVTGNVMQRSFYRVLKEFVVELQDRSFTSDSWDKSELVFIDETFSKEHIKILSDANIIRKYKNDPLSYYLIKQTKPPKRSRQICNRVAA